MVMPGMCMCCADAGAASGASATTPAAMSSLDFTMFSGEEGDAGTRRLPVCA